MTEPTDRELLRLARGGVVEAFGSLFERHARLVYNFCFRRTAEWSTAEDLTSVVFLEAWRRRDTELASDSAVPSLLGVATNVLRNHRRSLGRYQAALSRLPPPVAQPDHAEEVVSRLESRAQMRTVLRLLRQLPQPDQEVFALIVWSGLSYTETAEALHVPVGTVRSRLSRARARLTELLESGGHGMGETLSGAVPIDRSKER